MKPLDHEDGIGGGSEASTLAHLDGRNVHVLPHLGDISVSVPDAELLFSGTYHQSGQDLIISRPFESVTIHDYFRFDVKPALTAADGSKLSAASVLALTEGRPGIQHAGDQPVPATAIGRVESASGEATVIRNGQTITLQAGDLVFKGDAVETGEHGSLAITFIDGTAFTLAESARMVLNDMVYQPGGSNNSSLLSLVQGSITFVAGEVAHSGDMKVDTPVATMGIRGTAVHVKISAHNGPSRFSVLREPNGRVGSYILYDHKSGAVIATVSEVGKIVEIQLNNGEIVIDTVAKTPLDFQQEQDLAHQVFAAFQAGQQDSLLKALMLNPNQGSNSHGSFGPPQTGPEGGQSNNPPPDNHLPVTPPSPPVQTPPVQPPPAPQNDTPPLTLNPVKITIELPVAPAETIIVAKNAAFTSALAIAAESVIGVQASNAQQATAVSANGTTVTGLYGDLTISSDGSFHYTADHAQTLYAHDTGVDVFTYTVTNASGLTAAATLTFDVIGANEAVIAAPSTLTISAGTVAAISGIAVSETGNTNGEMFTATVTDTHGSLSVTQSDGTVSGTGTASLSISGTLAQVNSDLATLTDTDLTAGSDTITVNFTGSYGESAQQTIGVTAVAPNLVVNGGFETGDLTGWTTNGFQLLYDHVQALNAHSGTYSLGIGATGGDFSLDQTISTMAGQTYQVDFWLSNSGGTQSDFLASFDGITLLSLTNSDAQGYTEYTYDVTATSSTTDLNFAARQDSSYWYLDDISVLYIGALTVTANATLDIGNAVAAGTAVTFLSTAGTLHLETPSSFAGTIAGISGNGDILDLAGFNAAYTSATTGIGSFNSATDTTALTVTDTHDNLSAVLTLTGDYADSSWIVTDDHNGGADIADPPAATSSGSGPAIIGLAADAGLSSQGDLITLTGETTGTDISGSIVWDQATASSPLDVENGSFSASQDLTPGDHAATLTLNDAATNSKSVQTVDIDISQPDAPFIFAPAAAPAVIVGSQSPGGSQTITGSPYADTIVAGAGNDTLTGNGGSDTFVFKTNMGNDQITDPHISNGNGAQDIIDISAFHFANYQALLAAATTDASGDAVIALGTHTLTLDHVAKADLQSSLFHL